MPSRHFRINGKVQNVGFRAFVVHIAQAMGVRGQVWNTRDEGVEIDAGHDDPAVLDAFAGKLHDGPGKIGVILQTDIQQELEDNFWIAETR